MAFRRNCIPLACIEGFSRRYVSAQSSCPSNASGPRCAVRSRVSRAVVLENSNKPYAACGMSFAFLLLPSGGSRVAGGLPLGRP